VLVARPAAVVAASSLVLCAAGCTGAAHPVIPPTPVAPGFTTGGQLPAGESPGQLGALIRRAWTATAAAGTAILTVHTTSRFVGTDQSVQSLAYTGTGPAVLPRAAADLRYRDAGNVRWHWLLIGDALYAAAPATGPATARVRWTRTDLGHPAPQPDSDSTPPNPVALLRDLSRSLTGVSPTGSAVIDGTPVTRYDATAELAAGAAAAPAGGARLAVARLERDIRSGHLYVQEWIDGSGRIRQLRYTDQVIPPKAPPAAGTDPITLLSITTSTTFTLTRFGTPAMITAPPTSTPVG